MITKRRHNLEYFIIAHKLNQAHIKELCTRRAHFRGSLNSFALVSLHKDTPEVGVKAITSYGQGEKKLRVFSPKRPHRATPEKELQVGIIRYAQGHNWILPFGENLRFLTSELAWPMETGGKVVNDILALNESGDLVIIELKYKRLKRELEEQLEAFCRICSDEANKEFFRGLVRLFSGREWAGGIKKMIVWPFKQTAPLKNWHGKIDEVCYLMKDSNGKKVIDCDYKGNIRFK